MTVDPDTLRACLYKLAELVELAWQLPPEDRARTERMIAQARQTVYEERRNDQQERARLTTTRTIVLQLVVKATKCRHSSAASRGCSGSGTWHC
jgi:hypothetical protein